MKIEPIIKPVLQEDRGLFIANKIASLHHPDTYLSIYFHPRRRFRYDRGVHNSLLSNTRALRKNLNTNPLLENHAYLMSRVTSCDILTEATRGKKSDC